MCVPNISKRVRNKRWLKERAEKVSVVPQEEEEKEEKGARGGGGGRAERKLSDIMV